MRRTLVTLGMVALVATGVVACDDTPGIMVTPLGFTVAEGLLLLSETDPTVGTVVLASNTGNCKAFQAGAFFSQILLSDFLTFSLQAQDATCCSTDAGFLPLTAGTYTIVTSAVNGAGLYATSTEFETDAQCNYSPTGANSGTVTVQPFNVSAASNATYSVVFGLDEFNGGFGLSTCVVPADAGQLDAGTCLIPGTLL
jgi:hypothetical protein